MLDAVVSRVITRTLKDYIEEMNSSQTQMKLWKGFATFDDVTLKETALSRHDLPLVIRRGKIGHINLAFPWKNLSSEACVVEVSDVYIVANLDEDILIRKDLESVPSEIQPTGMSKQEKKDTWQGLTSTIIDNARVNIKNIHVRLEYNLSNHIFIAIGFIIPKIELITVNNDNQPILAVRKSDVLRKRLTFQDLAIYFDTTTEPIHMENFLHEMQYSMRDSNHQWIMEPLTVEAILIHTRNNPHVIKNQLKVVTKKLGFSIDFLQSRAVLEISSLWKKFVKRRAFAKCYRPQKFGDDGVESWAYLHRCACATKWSHLIFDPAKALQVLSVRTKFLKLYKQNVAASSKKVSAMALINPLAAKSMEKLKEQVGKEVSGLLNYMGSELVRRDESLGKSDSFDINELKKYINSTDQFFSKTDFSIDLSVPSISIALNYAAGSPLVSFDVTQFSSTIIGSESGVAVSCILDDMAVSGHETGSPVKILMPVKNPEMAFTEIQCFIPTNEAEPKSVTGRIGGFLATFDVSVMDSLADFFADFRDRKEIIGHKSSTLKVSNEIQELLALQNVNLALRMDTLGVVFPVKVGEQVKMIKCGLNKIATRKRGYDKAMSFEVECEVNPIEFGEQQVTSKFSTSLVTVVEFGEDVSVDAKLNVGSLAGSIVGFNAAEFMKSIDSIKAMKIFNMSKGSSEIATIYDMEGVKFGFNFSLQEIVLRLEESDFICKRINVLNSVVDEYRVKIEEIGVLSNEFRIVETNNTDACELLVKLDQNNTSVKIGVSGVRLEMQIPWMKWLVSYANDIMKSLPESEESSKQEMEIEFSLSDSSVKCQEVGVYVDSLAFASNVAGEMTIQGVIDCDHSLLEKRVVEKCHFDVTGSTSKLKLSLSEHLVLSLSPDVCNSLFAVSQELLSLTDSFVKEETETRSEFQFQTEIRNPRVEIYDNDQMLATACVSSIDVDLNNDNTNVVVSHFVSSQFMNDKEVALIDFDKLQIGYQSGASDDIDIVLTPLKAQIGVPILSCLTKVNFDSEPNAAVQSSSLMNLKVIVEASSVALLHEASVLGSLSFGALDFCMSKDCIFRGLSLQLKRHGEHSSNDLLRLDGDLHLDLKDGKLTGVIPPVHFDVSEKLIQQVISIIPTSQSSGEGSSEISLPISADLVVSSINGNIALNNTVNLSASVENVFIAINGGKGVCGFKIDSLCMKHGDCKVMEVDNVTSVLSLTPDLNEMTFEDVQGLDCASDSPCSTSYMNMSINVRHISANYSHEFATSVLELSAPFMNSETSSPSQIRTEFSLKLCQAEVGLLVAGSRIALVRVKDCECSTGNKLSALVGALEVIPEDRQSLIISSKSGPLLSYEKQDSIHVVTLNDIDVMVDYAFWLLLASYVCKFPLLHTGTSDVSDDELVQAKVALPKLHLIIPTSLDANDLAPVLHVTLGLNLELSGETVSADASLMNVVFSNSKQNVFYVPMLRDARAKLTQVTSKNSVSYDIEVSRTNVALSVQDVVLFDRIYRSIDETLKSVSFNLPPQSESKEPSTIVVSFKFGDDVTSLELILCRDILSSNISLPVFRFSLPPIDFVHAEHSEQKNQTMVVQTRPSCEYFNSTTGDWDLIMEPCDLNILLMFPEKMFHVSVISSAININIPLGAASEYITLWNDIKDEFSRTKKTATPEVPMVWFANNLSQTVSLEFGAEVYEIEHEMPIPIPNARLDSTLVVTVGSRKIEFAVQEISYPTVFIPNVSLSFHGGTLVQLNSQFQLMNQTGVVLDVVVKEKNGWSRVGCIASGSAVPLPFNDASSRIFMLTDHESPPKLYHDVVKFGPNDTKPFTVTIGSRMKELYCLVHGKDDPASGTRVFKLLPPTEIVNKLPVSIYIQVSSKCDPVQITPEKSMGFLQVFQETSVIPYRISIDRVHFAKMNLLNLDTPERQTISVFSETLCGVIQLALTVERDEETKRVSLVIYSPCVIFNSSNNSIAIRDGQSITTIMSSLYGFWCPPNYSKDGGKMQLSVEVPALSTNSKVIDCSSATSDILFIPKVETTEMFVPLRYNIEQNDRTSVVTISPLLSITNELKETIVLQPILSIPKLIDDDASVVGLAASSTITGDPYVIESGQEVMIEVMPISGSFLLSVDGYSTSPALSFLLPQKTVLRVQSPGLGTKIVELEVQDRKTEYHGYIRDGPFPTPIMISNCLDDIEISACQVISLNPFIIPPLSTSVFVFDEPFAYPNAHLTIGDTKLNISLLEDSAPMELKQQHNGKPIIVSFGDAREGVKILTISTEVPEKKQEREALFTIEIEALRVSIIDNLVSEFLLLTVNDIHSDFRIDETSNTVKAHIGSLQVDDQRPLSQSPIVLHGRQAGSKRFMTFEASWPAESPFMSNFTYAHLDLQRIDCVLDASFISDCFNMAMALFGSRSQTIAPFAPSTSSASLIRLNWFEISPIYITAAFKSSRNAQYGPLLQYFKYIPSLSNVQILLPGILIAQITDTAGAIISKITDDYKAVAFDQIIQELGRTGRFMSTFGVTDAIANLLQIRRVSDLTSEISHFARSNSDPFDNRREIFGCFSQEALSLLNKMIKRYQLEKSGLIRGLLKGTYSGLKIKSIPGCGFGHGVFGVVTKLSIDKMSGLGVMMNIERQRLPRTYPGGSIAALHESIIKAQLVIHQSGAKYEHERIKLAFRCTLSQDYVCVTDNFVLIFDCSIAKIVKRISFAEITSVSIISSTLSISVKRKDLRFVFSDSLLLKRVFNFIQSHKTTISVYGALI